MRLIVSSSLLQNASLTSWGRGQGWGVDRKQVGASFLGVELHKHETLRYGWTKFYKLDEFVSYSKTNTVLPGFVLAFTVPEECVFLLFEASRTSKAGFLQGCNVDIQPSQLSANYGSFTWAISVPYVRGQSGQHRSHIPTPKSESLPFSV